MTLLDDLAAPGGHRAEQQALTDTVRVRPCQLREVADGFKPADLDALAVALKLQITLKTKVRVKQESRDLQMGVSQELPAEEWKPGSDRRL